MALMEESSIQNNSILQLNLKINKLKDILLIQQIQAQDNLFPCETANYYKLKH